MSGERQHALVTFENLMSICPTGLHQMVNRSVWDTYFFFFEVTGNIWKRSTLLYYV